jgi:hypothetical protein
MIALEPLAKLSRRVLWGRHTAVTDHGFGKPYGGGGVDVLAVDGVAMGEAPAGGVLHAPGSAAGWPFDTSPLLPADGQIIGGDPATLPEPHFDDAVPASVLGRLCRTRQDAITVAAAWLDGNKLRGERVCSFDGIAFRAGDFVSITLDDFDVDPQTRPVLRVALERTRVSFGLTDDLADGIIAKQIIELAKAGERNPDLLCEGALERLRGGLWGD